MRGKSILIAVSVTLALLGGYWLFIAYGLQYQGNSARLSQVNTINAQRYLYNPDKYKVILVGSSIVQRLNVDTIPGYCNLGFSALSSVDGLDICIKQPPNPGTLILVETNRLYKYPNTDFQQSLFIRGLWRIKMWILPLQEKYQPFEIAQMHIKPLFAQIVPNIQSALGFIAPPKPAIQNVHKDRFAKILAQQIKNMQEPDSVEVATNVKALMPKIQKLEQMGNKIVFFEMPMHSTLCDRPFTHMLRRQVLAYFPSSSYRYIQSPPCSEYVTSDGIHMTQEDTERYLQYLRLQISQHNK